MAAAGGQVRRIQLPDALQTLDRTSRQSLIAAAQARATPSKTSAQMVMFVTAVCSEQRAKV